METDKWIPFCLVMVNCVKFENLTSLAQPGSMLVCTVCSASDKFYVGLTAESDNLNVNHRVGNA